MVTRDFLKSVELFSALAPGDAEALASLAQEEVFQKGQTIFRERDAGGKLYLIVTGAVACTDRPRESRAVSRIR